MAEAFLRRTVLARGIDAVVSSAGMASSGEPATADGVDVMAARGIDITGHSSRRMNEKLLGSGDLILGMTREHVRESVVLRPEVYSRTFTLKEIVRRGTDAGARGETESIRQWLDRLHYGRLPTQQLGESPVDDVADPIGQGPAHYERTALELDELTNRLVDLLWQQVPSTPLT